MRKEDNLRGRAVWFVLAGRTIHGRVVTHIRDGKWMIEARHLPREYQRGAGEWTCRRIILPREQFTVKVPRQAPETAG